MNTLPGSHSLSAPADSDMLSCDTYREVGVRGVVQGVGFRPFVYRLAKRLGLNGRVWNNPQGVIVQLQGTLDQIHVFVREMRTELPAAARIDSVTVRDCVPFHCDTFTIEQSSTHGEALALVPPDLAICEDCRAEFDDPNNRRFNYAFINCTQCGPRFSIIKDVPYDRPATTMAPFVMCPDCLSEYHEPSDRRFHAQPVACSDCGPALRFSSIDNGKWNCTAEESLALEHAVSLINRGGILLLQGIGGFHLVCDAANELAVTELRLRKRRELKPLAVMFPDLTALNAWCSVSDLELECLTSRRAPIVIVNKRENCPIAKSVSPGSPTLGALLPYSPLHLALLKRARRPLVMTSANFSDDPIEFREASLRLNLSGIADGVLQHDREIHMFADDSVVRVAMGAPRVWRRSRGFVPESITVAAGFGKTTLGFGADLKSAFALGKNYSAILTQYLGSLDNQRTVETALSVLSHFLHLFDARIERTVCDLHPDYFSTRLAEEWACEHQVPLVRVQHHHAHLAACLAEFHVSDPTVGLILDGAGYGPDGTIWGSELLYGDLRAYRRIGHLLLVPLIGNDAAAHQPWRMALSWLNLAFEDQLLGLDLPLMDLLRKKYDTTKLELLFSSSVQEGYTRTSSMGRLFDAAAAIAGFGLGQQFEGQAAMWLEGNMSRNMESGYSTELTECQDELILSPLPMIRELVADCNFGTSSFVMSRRFHEGIAQGLVNMTLRALELTGSSRVALNGGCFQNKFLLERIGSLLEARGVHVMIPRNLPLNDGSIAFGQICVANELEH